MDRCRKFPTSSQKNASLHTCVWSDGNSEERIEVRSEESGRSFELFLTGEDFEKPSRTVWNFWNKPNANSGGIVSKNNVTDDKRGSIGKNETSEDKGSAARSAEARKDHDGPKVGWNWDTIFNQSRGSHLTGKGHKPMVNNNETNTSTPGVSRNPSRSVKTITGLTYNPSLTYKPSSLLKAKRKEYIKTSSTAKEAVPILSNMDRNATLTVADLERILRNNEFVRAGDLKDPSALKKSSTSDSSSKTHKGVAFPQPSVVSDRALRMGSTITTAFLSFLLAVSVSPSLWLAGSVLGALYGQKVAETESAADPNDTTRQTAFLGDFVLYAGRRSAAAFLSVYDLVQGVWFMYRTGQLSYQYYKTYASLDDKFKIQDKVDAWNARFQEGKQKFDAWERENEVGRKILAGLRTAWLVEEKSFKKMSNKTKKYRIVRYWNDFASWLGRLVRAIWEMATGKGNDGLNEIFRGVRVRLAEANFESLSRGVGSGLALVVVVNFFGGLFAIAPGLSGVTAFILGMLWPTWTGGTYRRVRDAIEKTAARGRGEVASAVKKRVGRVDKMRYNYFLHEDGTKRWYRTGKSKFYSFHDNDKGKKRKKNSEEESGWSVPWFG